jgi:AcrR family transcriptional regulator
MPRMRPEIRRRTIVAAATNVAMRKGLSATTVRDIADEMGTSSGLIHHYFDSMDDLLATVFAEVAKADLDDTRRRVDGRSGVVAQLAAFLEGYAQPDSDTTVQFWLDAWSEAGRNDVIRRTSRDLNVAWQETLAEIVRDGIASGELGDVDASAVAWRALSLLDGLSLQVVPHRSVISRDTAARWAAEAIERELGLDAGALLAATRAG